MAINIDNTKLSKEQILYLTENNSEDVNYSLYLTHEYGDELIAEGVVTAIETDNALSTSVDGKYKLTLSDSIDSESYEFYVYKYLQSSIISEAIEIVCEECAECGHNVVTKDTFLPAKLHAWEGLVMPNFSSTYLSEFGTYKKLASNLYSTKINNFTKDITSSERMYVKTTAGDDLFTIYAIIYWVAMYLKEEAALTLSSDIEALKSQFSYNTMSECILKKGCDINALRGLYSTAVIADPDSNAYYMFNFTTPTETSSDVNDSFLSANALQYTEDQMLSGQTVTVEAGEVGKIGIVIDYHTPNQYRITQGGVDVTTSFTRTYNAVLGREIYLTNNAQSVPGDYIYKLEKL